MHLTRVFILLTGLAGVIAVVTGLFGVFEVAVAALACTILAAFGWMVMWSRFINAKLARTDTHGVLKRQNDVLDAQVRKTDALSKDLYQVLVTVQRTPSVTVELGRAYDRIVDDERPMPELGDWAMTASTLTWILNRVFTTPVRMILECGSGSSTIWFATALEQRGGEGRVVALESSAEYARTTRAEIVARGLEHRAEVIHAPLVDTPMEGRGTRPWFDLAGLPDLPPVDLLFVDGPVGGIAKESRYPAFAKLADRLAPGAVVILDDTGRPDEARIVKTWTGETHHGRELQIIQRLDRSTVMATVDAG